MSDQERPGKKRSRHRRRSTGDPDLGLRVRKARLNAGLSQEQAAHQVERSDRWLLKVENGQADPGYGDLIRLAPVLNVQFEQLVLDKNIVPSRQTNGTSGPDPAMMVGNGLHAAGPWVDELRRRGFLRAGLVVTGGIVLGLWPAFEQATEAPQMAALRRALLHYGPERVDELPDLATLRQQVNAASADTQASRYSRALHVIPSILTRARVIAEESDARQRSASLQLLAQAYHVSISILRKMGDTHLAIIAADRGLAAAQTSGDPGAIASAASVLGDVLADSRHYQQAVDLCTQVAAAVQPEIMRRDDPQRLSVYGRLLLSGAEAAAQAGDRTLSNDFYREADGAARLLGGDANHQYTAFGPTNITIHRVHAAIVLGYGERAVQLAREVELARLPVLERQAHFMLDVAIAHGLMEHPELAVTTLLAAEQLAPEEVWLDPGARALVEEIRQRTRRSDAQLNGLSERIRELGKKG